MRATVTLSSCWAGIFDIVGVAAALAVVAARAPEIIVDLAGLEFIDSSGVAALARGRKLARHAGGDLLLAAPRHQVLRVLTLTRLIDVFPIYASVDEAARTAGLTGRRPRQWTGVPLASRDRISAASSVVGQCCGAARHRGGIIRPRACAYARDRSVPGLVRDFGVRRLRLCPGLGPCWDGQA